MTEILDTELLMFYNVENLFLPDPKPHYRGQKSKSGLFNWNEYRYQIKLKKIAHVFRLIEQDTGRKPMICGLAEVQGKRVLKDLLHQDIFSTYDFLHFESLDERGVDVALLYDKTKVEVLHAEPISYFFKIEVEDPTAFDTTRDVLYCKLKVEDEIFNVFVIHLPSKRIGDINKPRRDFILNKIADRITSLADFSQNESMVLMGDFNADPIDEMVSKLNIDKNFNTILTNPYKDLFLDKKFSTFHHDIGMVFDQILLSNRFFKDDNSFRFKKAEIFQNPTLCVQSKGFLKKPLRTYSGTRYLGGYSDHFPVICKLNKTKQT